MSGAKPVHKQLATPTLTLKPDGTVVINAAAAHWAGLAKAGAMSVYFSVPMQRLVLRPDRGGVRLERIPGIGGFVGIRAAEFLRNIGALPNAATTYDVRCYPDMLIADIRPESKQVRRHVSNTERGSACTNGQTTKEAQNG